jgi:hypothetical protein
MILLRLIEHAAAGSSAEPFVILAQGGPLPTPMPCRPSGDARPGEKPDAVVQKLLARLADDPPAGAVVSTVVLPDYVAALAAAGLAPDVLVHETADMYPAETQADIARNARRLVFASRDTEARFRRRVPGTPRGEVIYTGATLTPNVTPEPAGDPIVLGGTVTGARVDVSSRWRGGRRPRSATKSRCALPVGAGPTPARAPPTSGRSSTSAGSASATATASRTRSATRHRSMPAPRTCCRPRGPIRVRASC